jgi:predicted amidohydrolase YtcJ
MPMADRYWGDRVSHAYTWKAQLDHGARLAFGSDAPVESPNPFLGLHAAVTRQRADGSPGPDGWIPDQRLDLSAALRGFTSGPAETAGLADRLGRLEPGYYADLIVLDRNLFDLPPGEIRDVGPRATMVGGRWVYPAGGPDLSV